MKKIVLITVVMILTACGDTNAQYDPTLYVTSEAVNSLKAGTALDITITPPEVTDDEVQSQIDSNLAGLTELITITDRPVKDGDTLNIDYEGKLDGVAFDGGTAQGASLTIGSNSFIPGFESGLIGATLGETLDLEVTFPEDYSNSPELAGQKTVFTVTVNGIQETKKYDLTDETAKQLDESVSTADQYKTKIKDELTASRRAEYEANLGEYALLDISDKAVFAELPEDLVTTQNEALYNSFMDYIYQMQSYGLNPDDMILSQFGSYEGFNEYIATMAKETVKEEFLVKALAKALKYKASYKEIKAYAEERASGQKVSDYIKSVGGESAISTVIIREKVIAYLTEHAKLS